MSEELAGKVALISGAARGMGAEEARLFTSQGAKVLLGDVLDEEGAKVAAEIGEAARYIHLDVTSESDWLAAVALAEETFGRLDVLVNNAGILRFSLLEKTSLEEFELVMRVNQVGPFLGMKSCIPAMRRAGGGSIVNISSLAGMQGVGGAVAYTSSKFAVRGMTKVAAIELGGESIRVNSVHPGGVETPMTRPFGVDAAAEDSRAYTSPIPRIGRPDEVANLVLWLASDKSSYCTGSEFVIDGGEGAGGMPGPLRQLLEGR
ncbi:MAG: glucose 1-dehydrogenase [Myxococcales bacterium]|nr:glucose 1-dehydrogenase [Myxococcales bacterium]HIK84654.1 glucose 1-dehydrogenase [Myxococcales bacterium]